MKVRPTRTDAAGNGYYRGSNGKYYYGNAQNGYLKETIEERNKRVRTQQTVQQKQTVYSNGANRSYASSGLSEEMSVGGTIGGIGMILGGIVAFVLAVLAMGAVMVLGTILAVIAAAIGIVVVWQRAYSIIPSTFAEFGINLATIIIVLPLLLSLVVLVVLFIKTFTKHKLYVLHLFVTYAILFLPYAFIQCGGIQALEQGFITVKEFLYADFNCVAVCGIFPAIAMFLFHKIDMKAKEQQKKNIKNGKHVINL